MRYLLRVGTRPLPVWRCRKRGGAQGAVDEPSFRQSGCLHPAVCFPPWRPGRQASGKQQSCNSLDRAGNAAYGRIPPAGLWLVCRLRAAGAPASRLQAGPGRRSEVPHHVPPRATRCARSGALIQQRKTPVNASQAWPRLHTDRRTKAFRSGEEGQGCRSRGPMGVERLLRDVPKPQLGGPSRTSRPASWRPEPDPARFTCLV